MWKGLLVGYTLAAVCMAVLTHLLGEMMGEYVSWLKYFGAIYLLWLAWKMWRSSGQIDSDAKDCSFISGMIVQMTNAKMLLFELTVFSAYVLPYSHSLYDLLLIIALLELAGPGGNMAWIYAGAYLRRFISRYQKQLDIVMALLLVLCAIYVVL